MLLIRLAALLALLATAATAQDDSQEECSVGVACGHATADGRPLLWKNRDSKRRDNVVKRFDDGRFPYVGLCNAGASKNVWGGANAAGFCIMNSLSRDLTGDSETGPGNGTFMKLALQRCATVEEFEALLHDTDKTGRQTRANFGVIDAVGGAAIFETGHDSFVRFDAAAAEDGIIVRANFATTADGTAGKERFARATAICIDRPRSQPLDHRFLLRAFCRDLTPPPSAQAGDAGLQDVRETIHRQTTVASMVFHGVARGESPATTTMWALLGQPLFTVAVPVWPAAADVARAVHGDPRSALCDAARQLQDRFYVAPGDADEPEHDDQAGAIRWLRADGVDRVLAALLPVEDRILAATAKRLAQWREAPPEALAEEMSAFHRRQVALAVAAVRELAAGGDVRVVGELDGLGAEPPAWTLSVNGSDTAVSAAGFDVTVPRAELYSVRVDVPGHYATLHTFAHHEVDGGELRVPAIELVPRTENRRLLVFGGDAMLGRRFERPRKGEPVLVEASSVATDAARILRPIAPYLELADLASVNLETQVFDEVPADSTPKSVTFFTRPGLLDALAGAGVDYVALGNNHTYDYGEPGVARTLEHLRASPLAFSGAGRDEDEARRPARLEVAGTPVVLHSYVGWRGTFDPHQAAEGDKGGAALGTLDVIEQDLHAVDGAIQVLQFHSGTEYSDAPSMRVETALAHAIDCGADVAIGHHPHVIQGFDLHRGRLVAHSLGNFLFDQYIYGTQLGMLLYVWLDGEEFVRAEAAPLYVQGYTPTPAVGRQRDAVIRRLVALSDHDELELRGSGGHLVIAPRTGDDAVARIAVDATAAITDFRALVPAARRIVGVDAESRVRLGADLWSRGDFEHHALHGAPERGWLEGPNVEVVDADGGKQLRAAVRPGATERVGMRTFMRKFTGSADVTLRFRARATAPVTARVYLQRRRPGAGLDEALEKGPRTLLGELELDPAWREHRVDFAWPRLPTTGVRIVAELRGDAAATVDIDDWELIEWCTPPLDPRTRLDHAGPFTHLGRLGGEPGPVTLLVAAPPERRTATPASARR